MKLFIFIVKPLCLCTFRCSWEKQMFKADDHDKWLFQMFACLYTWNQSLRQGWHNEDKVCHFIVIPNWNNKKNRADLYAKHFESQFWEKALKSCGYNLIYTLLYIRWKTSPVWSHSARNLPYIHCLNRYACLGCNKDEPWTPQKGEHWP